MSDEAWKFAVKKAESDLRFFPKPIELREYARSWRPVMKAIEYQEMWPDKEQAKAHLKRIMDMLEERGESGGGGIMDIEGMPV